MLKVFVVNCAVIAVAVLIHYEFLYHMTKLIRGLKIGHRYRIVLGVFGSLIAHSVEVWVFAVAYYNMHRADNWGHLEGNFSGTLMDCVYFSYTTFTTLGFGDVQPIGDLRYLTGMESLTGLVLITWTASFLYIEMQRYWGTS